MADAEITPASSAPAATPAPVAAAPVSAAPAASPSPSSEPAVSSGAAPASAAPAAEAVPSAVPAAPAKAADAAPAASLLSAEPDAKVEAATADGAEKPEEKKPDAEKPADAPAETTDKAPELPKFEPFTVPEGIKPDEKAMGEFTSMLAEFEASKPDHEKFQAFGQKALEFHISRLSQQSQELTDYYVSLHNQQKAAEFEELRKDPAIGASDDKKFEQYGRDMANFLARNGGSKEEVTAFRKFAEERGVANALPLVRVLHNLKAKIDRYETEASTIIAGTKPAGEKAAPGKGIMNALYGNTRK